MSYIRSAQSVQVFIHDFKFLDEQRETDSPNCADLPSILHLHGNTGEVSILQGLLGNAGGEESDEMHRLTMKQLIRTIGRGLSWNIKCFSLLSLLNLQ